MANVVEHNGLSKIHMASFHPDTTSNPYIRYGICVMPQWSALFCFGVVGIRVPTELIQDIQSLCPQEGCGHGLEVEVFCITIGIKVGVCQDSSTVQFVR